VPKTDQGVTQDRYMVIPRVLIFVTRGDQVLLIKGAPTKRLWANRYNGIGGHIERGEDALSAARREMAEETGLKGVGLRLVGTLLVDASERVGICLFIFAGECAAGDLIPSEEGALEWVSVGRLNEYPLVEDVKSLIGRILAMRPGDAPFSARSYYDGSEQLVVEIN
jgi:8-oxo-dGTP diphosphatase